ncbi:hypothetical protein FEM48_Zijuj09G0092200 [Ziziphus jujuba var. spinosa]|uniref:Rx N-terminal domain-containing protein n=1 Tax=Ziziphus jujuba var. spinosa TaxID=714518 RepID=A0A978US50_ZIZJJ|nr:hypothetical protein FEM48_Zijuj09G0092200 [Ziziphus jujuba var. spinosa]
MAELALSPLLQVVFDRLASPLLGKLRDLYDLKKNFEKLQYSLPMILAFLEDAEERQVADKAVKIWLNKLKNVAYDSDDLLDELAAEITLCEIRSNITRGNKVSGLLLPFKPSRRIFDVACELQEKLMVLDKITGEGLNLNFKKKGDEFLKLEFALPKGELTISSLENVRNAKEAKNANLKEKHLHVLGLSWGNNEVALNTKSAGKKVPGLPCGSGGSDAGLEVDDILACLEPHPNLRKLFIKGFPGFKFPFWVLPNLVALALINCKRCESLPALGHLPFLETLYLQGMDNIKHISREFYGQDSQKLFPSLKELTLREFPNLEDWCGMDNTEVFPQLRKLILEKCPNLMAVPLFPSVQHVELQDCHPSIINSMENSTSLSNLVIHTFPGLLLLSEELLKNNGSLTSLKISSCQNLHSLPSELEKLTALKSLSISWCEELSCLPQGLQYLKSLESLEISECHGLFSLPDDGVMTCLGYCCCYKALVFCNNFTGEEKPICQRPPVKLGIQLDLPFDAAIGTQ